MFPGCGFKGHLSAQPSKHKREPTHLPTPRLSIIDNDVTISPQTLSPAEKHRPSALSRLDPTQPPTSRLLIIGIHDPCLQTQGPPPTPTLRPSPKPSPFALSIVDLSHPPTPRLLIIDNSKADSRAISPPNPPISRETYPIRIINSGPNAPANTSIVDG